MIDRNKIYAMLTKEDDYAKGWASNSPRPDGSVKTDHMASVRTGLPFSEMEWIVFAEQYLNDAKTAYANYLPDPRTVRIRILKAASLLVSCLQCHAEETDLADIAGVSSRNFPLIRGGLAALQDARKAQGGSVKEDQA